MIPHSYVQRTSPGDDGVNAGGEEQRWRRGDECDATATLASYYARGAGLRDAAIMTNMRGGAIEVGALVGHEARRRRVWVNDGSKLWRGKVKTKGSRGHGCSRQSRRWPRFSERWTEATRTNGDVAEAEAEEAGVDDEELGDPRAVEDIVDVADDEEAEGQGWRGGGRRGSRRRGARP